MGRPAKYGKFREILEQKADECRKNGIRKFRLPFEEIERWGVQLPRSAYEHREWWANVRNNGLAVAYEGAREKPNKPWQQAGFETESVDIRKQTVTLLLKGKFSPGAIARIEAAERDDKRSKLEKLKNDPVKARWCKQEIERLQKELGDSVNPNPGVGMDDVTRPYVLPPKEADPSLCRHPIYGALKGHIRLVAGTDLTQPADPEWGERVWGKDKRGKDKK